MYLVSNILAINTSTDIKLTQQQMGVIFQMLSHTKKKKKNHKKDNLHNIVSIFMGLIIHITLWFYFEIKSIFMLHELRNTFLSVCLNCLISTTSHKRAWGHTHITLQQWLTRDHKISSLIKALIKILHC